MFFFETLDRLKTLVNPRTENFSLIGNPATACALILAYLYVVKIGGPRWMKHCKPYTIKAFILAYNATMVVANAFLFHGFLTHSYFGGGYSWICQADIHNVASLPLLEYCWWAFMLRMFEFLDTVFFVLRKKDAHVSFLHVLHHSLVVVNGWFFMTFGSLGQPILGVCINSFIHTVMYFYHFLAALGEGPRKYLGWKRYLPLMQIAQFVVFAIFMSVPLFKDFGYQRYLAAVAALEGVLFLNTLCAVLRESMHHLQRLCLPLLRTSTIQFRAKA